MVVPYPFTRALFLYGEPIVVPRDGDVEEWRVKVEEAINELALEAEMKFEQLWTEGER
jgi:lysophospholipid acyltransferase (LPLAT)-like uncharacterized protein